MTQPADAELALIDPIFTAGAELPGTERVSLHSAFGKVFHIPGRVVAQGLPCSVKDGRGVGGCGEEGTMTLVRHPLRGVNLPGKRAVGLMAYCSACGPGLPELVTPTAQEIADGWTPAPVA
jgi:hypothetical protein